MQLREDGCLLICVEKRSYHIALQSIHASTFMEHGLELLAEVVEEEGSESEQMEGSAAEETNGGGDKEPLETRYDACSHSTLCSNVYVLLWGYQLCRSLSTLTLTVYSSGTVM